MKLFFYTKLIIFFIFLNPNVFGVNLVNSDLSHISSQEMTKILNFLAAEEKDCCWIPEYPIITELINRMGLKVGCEIGVAYGGQSKYFLENTEIQKLYSIDPYRNFTKNEYNDFLNFEQKVHDVLYSKVKQKLEIFGTRSELIRKTSEEAVKNFEDNSIDFVYIDANHYYEYVKKDLQMWYSKVRTGGLIAGDDYINWPGVSQALKEFAHIYNIEFHVQGNKWWFIKK